MADMEGMEEKLNAVLANPQLMQQIMTMAQSLSGGQDGPSTPSESPTCDGLNPELLQGIITVAGKIGADPHQKALLSALRPYLTDTRIAKLERAMRAAKLASLASAALSGGALSFLNGR